MSKKIIGWKHKRSCASDHRNNAGLVGVTPCDCNPTSIYANTPDGDKATSGWKRLLGLDPDTPWSRKDD